MPANKLELFTLLTPEQVASRLDPYLVNDWNPLAFLSKQSHLGQVSASGLRIRKNSGFMG